MKKKDEGMVDYDGKGLMVSRESIREGIDALHFDPDPQLNMLKYFSIGSLVVSVLSFLRFPKIFLHIFLKTDFASATPLGPASNAPAPAMPQVIA